MRRRLLRLTESDWTTIDRLLTALLVAIGIIDVCTTESLEGPLAANLAVVTFITLSSVWRRTRPLVTVVCSFSGFLILAIFLTQPPDLFISIVVLVTLGYSVGQHLVGTRSVLAVVFGAVVVVTVSVIYDPGDIFFPVSFFWIVPWLAGRTLRNQTMLARELAEKAERAEHAREEDERRAIALERNRIARELHDVLAHNLSVMVVQASAARRIVDRNPDAGGRGGRADPAHRPRGARGDPPPVRRGPSGRG